MEPAVPDSVRITKIAFAFAALLALLAPLCLHAGALAAEPGGVEAQALTAEQAQSAQQGADGNAAAGIDGLSDGTYTLKSKVLQPDKKTASMADKGLKHKVTLEVSGGTYTLSVTLKGIDVGSTTGYLQTMKRFKDGYKVNEKNVIAGKTASVNVLSYQKDGKGLPVKDSYGANYPKKLSFALIDQAKTDGYVPLQVFIPIMEAISKDNGTKTVFLKLDLASLEKASSGAAAKNSTAKATGAKTSKTTKASKAKKKASSKKAKKAANNGTSLDADTLQTGTNGAGSSTSSAGSAGSTSSSKAGKTSQAKQKKASGKTHKSEQAGAYAAAPVLEEVDDTAYQNGEFEDVDVTVDAAQAVRVAQQVQPQPPLKRYIPLLIALPVGVALACLAYAALKRKRRAAR